MGSQEHNGHSSPEDYFATPHAAVDPLAQLPPHLLQRLRTRHKQARPTPSPDADDKLASLVSSLGADEESVRTHAIRALGKLQDQAPMNHLLLALHDSSWVVRSSAAQALGKLGRRAPISPLLTALQDKDESVRASAAGALGNIKNPESVPALTQALRDPSWHVRDMAVLALGEMEHPDTLPNLALALDDDNEQVRYAVRSLQEKHARYYGDILTTHASLLTQEQDIGEILAPQQKLETLLSGWKLLPARLRLGHMRLTPRKTAVAAQSSLATPEPRPARTHPLASFWHTQFTLTIWQLRECWHLLGLSGIGMIVAIILVCSVPLYSEFALSQGLHTLLTTTPDNSLVTIHDKSLNIQAADTLSDHENTYQQALQNNLGNLLSPLNRPQVVLQSDAGLLQLSTSSPSAAYARMTLNGYEPAQVAPHVTLLSGRLPRVNPASIEIALLPEAARALNVQVGSTLSLQLFTPFAHSSAEDMLPLLVVGIFTPQQPSAPFWHGNTFETFSHGSWRGQYQRPAYQALTDVSGTVSFVQRHYHEALQYTSQPALLWSVNWYYKLDITGITLKSLPALTQGLSTLESDLNFVETPLSIVTLYQQRVAQVEIPTLLILLFITGMIVLFVAITSSQVLDNRNSVIAVLRSRGASRGQIFISFIAAYACVGLLALLIGPALAIPLARFLTTSLLPGAFQTVYSPDWQTQFMSICWYALAAILASLLACMYTVYRHTALDMVSLHQQQTRNLHLPAWQRFHLDLFAALIALAGYSVALSQTSHTTDNWEQQALIVSPVTLVAALSTSLLFLLLFLRFFPRLLAGLARLADLGRGAAPTLAFAQIARAPRHALGSTLLLALTTAFAVFTLLFMASQERRAVDIATYIVGADFSGTFSGSGSSPVQTTSTYEGIPGVRAASTGYITTAYTHTERPVGVQAVDPDTFEQAVIWPSGNSSPPLSSLLSTLQQERASALERHVVPAYVDEQTWSALHLAPGKTFVLSDASGGAYNKITITFVALQPISHIPTYTGGLLNARTTEGLLVDYPSYVHSYNYSIELTHAPIGFSIGPNYFWLRTYDDEASLSSVRTQLARQRSNTLALNTLYYDRRSILTNLFHDPLYVNMLGLLTLGALIPLVLAFIGCFITTWTALRHRLFKFSLLRALGSAPRQLASLLAWEQIPLYLVLILLGVAAGWLLSTLTLPVLIISSLTTRSLLAMSGMSGDGLTTSPDLPSVQMVVPFGVWLALALLILIALLTSTMMLRHLLRLSLHRTLRLPEE